MLMLLSPAKSLNLEPLHGLEKTRPVFISEADQLARMMQAYNPEDIQEMMHVSAKIANLNYQRYHDWKNEKSELEGKQALYVFEGDVYKGLDAGDLNAQHIDFAQNHLRILSGLYGLLRPLDVIQPYRLEMGTKFKNETIKTLYEFWGTRITEEINRHLSDINSAHLINLASNEYFKSIKTKNVAARIITPVFKDYKNGKYKIISFFAKKARGMMAAYIIKNNITDVEDLKLFDSAGYCFDNDLSTENEWVFTRNNT
jgi:uncharacterized protein